jgi:hypothetical protein
VSDIQQTPEMMEKDTEDSQLSDPLRPEADSNQASSSTLLEGEEEEEETQADYNQHTHQNIEVCNPRK